MKAVHLISIDANCQAFQDHPLSVCTYLVVAHMMRAHRTAWLLVAFAALASLRAEAGEPVRSAVKLRQRSNGAFALPAAQRESKAVTYLQTDGEPEEADPPEPFISQPLEGLPPTTAASPDAWTGFEPELPPAACDTPWYAYWQRARAPHRDPNDPERHFGIGDPLLNTSWRNRPLYVSLFTGGLIGDNLQEGLISQGGGFFAGGRFGGDFDHYWGVETRLAFSDLNLTYADGTGNGQSRDAFFDVDLLYYPWGDSRWRPYLTAGLGMASYRFQTRAGTRISASAMELPFGGGVKYLFTPNVALRFDLIDNFTFAGGSRVDSLHNISFTGGIEFRFGGRRTSYGSW